MTWSGQTWRRGTFHVYLRSRAHLRLNRCGVYAGQSVALPRSPETGPPLDVECSPIFHVSALTCPRCGWRLDSIGHEENCERRRAVGRGVATSILILPGPRPSHAYTHMIIKVVT